MKNHSGLELKKFTLQPEENGATISLTDFLKTKIDRDDTIVKVTKNGSFC